MSSYGSPSTTVSTADGSLPVRPEREPAAYYDHWLRIFAEAQKIALAVQYDKYWIDRSGLLSVRELRALCTDEQYARLLEHALCLACLNGNAFPDLIEQYVPEAYASLRSNGWTLDERPARSGLDFDDRPLTDGAEQRGSASTTGPDDASGTNP